MTPAQLDALAGRVARAFVLAERRANNGGGPLDASRGPAPMAQVELGERESIVLLLEPDASHPKATPRLFAGAAVQVYWHRWDRYVYALAPLDALRGAAADVLLQLLPSLDRALEALVQRPRSEG